METIDPSTTVPSAGKDRRLLLALVAGTAVLAAGAYFVVIPAISGGHSTTNTAAGVVPHHRALGSAARAVAPAVHGGRPTPATHVPAVLSLAGLVGRDPFVPLYVAPAAAAAPGTGSAAAGTPSVATTAGGSTVAPSGAGTSPSTSASPVASPASGPVGTPSSTTVRLVKVLSANVVDVSVNSTVYQLSVGRSAGNVVLNAVPTAQSATFTFGEQTFTLALGAYRTFS